MLTQNGCKANILINEAGQACLCDFGLITFSERQTMSSTQSNGLGGSLRWKAPEIIYAENDSKLRKTCASDVYAFGMTILEVRGFNQAERVAL
jgi:serine/threonine protein kinase